MCLKKEIRVISMSIRQTTAKVELETFQFAKFFNFSKIISGAVRGHLKKLYYIPIGEKTNPKPFVIAMFFAPNYLHLLLKEFPYWNFLCVMF